MKALKINESTIEEIFQIHIQKRGESLNFVVDLVNAFRKSHHKNDTQVSISPLLLVLKNNELYQIYFKEAIEKVFVGKRKIELMTDAGLINDLDFFFELRQRISHKIVPSQPLKENIQYALNQVFHSKSDIKWLSKISFEELQELSSYFDRNNLYSDSENQFIIREIVLSVLIISQRMGGLALQTNVRNLVPEFNNFESPFIALDRELNIICNEIIENRLTSLDSAKYKIDLKQLNVLATQCENFVQRAFDNSSHYGISFKVNQTLLLITQQIGRLRELYYFLFTENEEDKQRKSIYFFLNLVLYNNTKNNIRSLIDDSLYNITYEITTHTSRTGEHYITSSKREYFNMLKTASYGGIIVGFLCLFKLLIYQTEMSQFSYALAYSLNYGLGFVTIYLTGSTLATKQPAMTASTIAHSLENINLTDKKSKNKRYSLFSSLFAKVFRSQFIAFVGNVFLAFPTALLLSYLYTMIFGYNVSESKSSKLLADLNILETPVIFHAFIAGIFLFLSGIIAGKVANRNNYTNFYYRLSEHPFLKRVFGVKKTAHFSKWMKKKWPGIMSNVWFGIFMGCTAVVGTFLGLNLDIRHITFSSGNFALGVFGADFDISLKIILWSILGIGIIGFVNFMVSFTLSILIALRSRNIPFGELRNMGISILQKLKEQPLLFFFPVTEKTEK